MAAALLTLAAAPDAFAHATLLETEPSRDAVVEESPGHVVLHFDEPVESALGSLRVYDGAGRQVDAGEIMRPRSESVQVAIERRLPRGTYTVAWRVVSADSDPIRGAWVFHVEEPGARPAGIAGRVLEGTPPLTSWLYTIFRGLDYALLLLCVGGTAALTFVLGSAAPLLRWRLRRVLAALALGLVVAALAGLVLQGAAAEGMSVGEAATWDTVSSVVDTRFGTFSLMRAGLAVALAATVLGMGPPRPRGQRTAWALAPVCAVGMVITPVLAGHASTSTPLVFAADLVHIQAASVWTGGLGFVVLALVLARSERWPLAIRAVPRFSNMAVISVAALITGAVVNAVYQVDAWRGLWETSYGRLVLAKIAIILPLLSLGAFNNRYSVPRLRAGIASVLERRRFLRAVSAELTLMTAVVGVTAVLVNEAPARDHAVTHEPTAEVVDLGPIEAHVSVEPGAAGRNEVHLMFRGHGGEPPELAEVRVSATLPDRGIGPLRLRTRRAERHGQYMAIADLPIAGDWELRIEARRGELELFSETVSIPIREEA